MNLPRFAFQTLARAVLAAAAISLLGCASARLDFMDPAQAAAGFRNGPIAIAGVVQSGSEESLSDWDRNTAPNELGELLGKKRRGFSVIPWERFRDVAGRPNNRVSGNGNPLRNAFSSSQLSKARNLGATYALLVEVCENRTWKDVAESWDTDTTEIRDKDGNVISCYKTDTFTTSSRSHRQVRARYFLYELRTGEKVWVTSSDHREVRTNSSCSSCGYPPPPPFPEPPSAADVMKDMSAAAIRKLPRK